MGAPIINLSNMTLTEEETEILKLGIKFVPAESTIPKKSLDILFHRLIRSIKLKDYFRGYDNKEIIPFRKKSKWEPYFGQISPETAFLVKRLTRTYNIIVKEFTMKKHKNLCWTGNKPNISNNNNLKRLMNRKTDMVFRKADKGSSFVILSKKAYTTEVQQQLEDRRFYEPLQEPRHPQNKIIINDYIQKGVETNLIKKETAEYLKITDKYNTRKFYILPKIHKPIGKWPDPSQPPGRPIVSDINTESSRIASFIDFYINKHSKNLNSFLRDSFDFVEKIKDTKINEEDILVTGDVTALYTNMKFDRTIKIVMDLFRDNPEMNRPDPLILDLLDFTLRNNDFEFEGNFFLQTCGCAMGKKYSPGLANLYMKEIDDYIYTFKPKLFFRYLDDIFIVWDGDKLHNFIELTNNINTIIDGINIEFQTDKNNITFLDVTVYKSLDKKLGTKTYFKPTNNKLLLNPISCHPKHTFRGIMKSQILRFKRLSSDNRDFIETSREYIKIQINNGFSARKSWKILGEIIRYQTPEKITKPEILPIILPFSKLGSKLGHQFQKLIGEEELFRKYKTVKAFTITKNLQRLLF